MKRSRYKLIQYGTLLSLLTYIILNAIHGMQSARIAVTVLDENQKSTPVRVRLVDPLGKVAPLPDAAIGIMYGRNDQAERYQFQPDSSFYVDGTFELSLKPGTYYLSLSKGNEYLSQRHEVILKEGEHIRKTYHLERWINMPARGWYSADDHIHIRRSPRENPLILKWIAAEDVHVGVLLRMGDFWRTYYAQYAFGKAGLYQEEDFILTPGQEESRTHELGHTIVVAADSSVRFRNQYYFYDMVFDKIHTLGGLTGYAHQGISVPWYQSERGMALDVLRGKVDFLEILQFCLEGGPLLTDAYYQYLDLGYKLTATAGSDFPWYTTSDPPRWNARIGNVRFYTYVGKAFSFEKWKSNFKGGHTFVTSGPIIDLRVNGKLPGDELEVRKGDIVTIEAKAYGHPEQVPIQSLEVIGHGETIGLVVPNNADQTTRHLSISLDLPVEHGLWIAAKCTAGQVQVAHTTPIYVTVNGRGFQNPKTFQNYLDISEKHLHDLKAYISRRSDLVHHNGWRYKDGLTMRIEQTLNVIENLRENLN